MVTTQNVRVHKKLRLVYGRNRDSRGNDGGDERVDAGTSGILNAS
jgi:hypothetical protein